MNLLENVLKGIVQQKLGWVKVIGQVVLQQCYASASTVFCIFLSDVILHTFISDQYCQQSQSCGTNNYKQRAANGLQHFSYFPFWTNFIFPGTCFVAGKCCQNIDEILDLVIRRVQESLSVGLSWRPYHSEHTGEPVCRIALEALSVEDPLGGNVKRPNLQEYVGDQETLSVRVCWRPYLHGCRGPCVEESG